MAYIRTPLTLLSPGWDQSVSSADGMHVYAMAFAPVVLLSDDGRMMRAYISRREETE
jgi:intracellular multiplication protein IcmK